MKWGPTPETLSKCSNNCVITNNKEQLRSLSDFDAVIFHYRDLDKLGYTDLPNPEFQRQTPRYIMFFMETPQNYKYNYDR